MVMHQLDARIRKMLENLKRITVRRSIRIEGIEYADRILKEEGENYVQTNETVFRPFVNGSQWGEETEWVDFRFRVTVPEDFTDRVVVSISTGMEAGWDATNPQFVVRVNGRIEQAFDVNHTTLLLQEKAQPGEVFEIELNGYSARKIGTPRTPVLNVALEDVNWNFVQLIYDMESPYQAALLQSAGQREREVTLETIARVIDMMDIRRPHSREFDEAVAAAREYLKTAYYDERRKLVPEAFAESMGHTHIDVAWLWDLYQTRHKAVRSFSTVLKLMEEYPEYTFMSSQAHLYNVVREDEPELFERIRQRVAEGRWEPEGGMWVEADCNVTGGESLVRQFLHGQEFFSREFGKPSRTLWLPDVFGYSAALPQILKLSGIDYFMTTKLSWSEFNCTPCDTFMWKGIDGSEVLTHFSPSRDFGEDRSQDGLSYFTTYNAMMKPTQVAGGWQRFQNKAIDNHFIVSYGYGDGGGGTTPWMVENARRMDVPLPNTPVVQHSHARPFFEALEKRVKDDPRLPKWSGELYLEYHRGTYTAMARNKKSNRKIELKLRDVELWCARAAKEAGFEYPAAKLHKIWEDVLTLQFHDILPGSSIKKVYDDSKIMYEQMFAQLNEIEQAAIAALSKGTAGDVLAYKSLSHERADVIWFDAPEGATALRDAAGRRWPVQFVEGKACAFVRGMKPMTETPYWFTSMPVDEADMTADEKAFETEFFSGRFGTDMRIVSLTDKRSGRQIVKPGEALNRIVCYENKPHNYDAWDVNIYYDRRQWEVNNLVSAEVVSRGPVMTVVRAKYAYMDSTISQDIILYQNIDRIDFKTTVDWKEMQYLLKAHFPVDVFYNEATFDIQYGNIKRATHTNTSWDVARFEVCAHKWIDVSEDGYGVSLLNDCKYGHSVNENGIALTLLKSSAHPNPVADIEVHEFTYSLMPHVGGWREAGTPEQAYRLNVPVLTAKGAGEAAVQQPFAAVANENIIIEVVKQALNGEGTVIRLYECYGRRTTGAKLNLGFIPVSAEICNLMEQPTGPACIEGSAITFDIKPYEIKTFLLK